MKAQSVVLLASDNSILKPFCFERMNHSEMSETSRPIS